MSDEQFDFEKSHNEFRPEGPSDIDYDIAELDIESSELLHFSLIQAKLLENGLNITEHGIEDYVQFSQSLVDDYSDPTCFRLREVITVLGFLENEAIPLEEINYIDEELVAQLEDVFLFEDEYDEVWLNSLRAILPSAEFLKSDDNNSIITRFRQKSRLRRDINNSMRDFKTHSREIIKNYIKDRDIVLDEDSLAISRILVAVSEIYEGESSETYEMAISLSRTALRELGIVGEKVVPFLRSVHDQALATE